MTRTHTAPTMAQLLATLPTDAALVMGDHTIRAGASKHSPVYVARAYGMGHITATRVI